MVPMDTVKQRRQLHVHAYRGTLHCLKRMLATEGMRGLYAGYTTTLAMNVPYHALYFNTYELARRRLVDPEAQTYSASHHMMAGGAAGVVAAALTNPLDVVRTRLQTQGDLAPQYHTRGLIVTMKRLWLEEGMRGLTRGLLPRMIFHSTSAAILWTSYEYFKYLLFPPHVDSVYSSSCRFVLGADALHSDSHSS